MYFTGRTDMAAETVRTPCRSYTLYGAEISQVTVDKAGEDVIGKPAGNYYTINLTPDSYSGGNLGSYPGGNPGSYPGGNSGGYPSENPASSGILPDTTSGAMALAAVLRKVLPKGKCLVVGLGNPEISADSLGWKAAQRILATSHYINAGAGFEGLGDVSVIRTNVSSNSGIESAVQVKATAKAINADYILAIDSLCCKASSRLCRNIQVCDTGIHPGSGAGNPRTELSRRTMDIPVIAIGVPTALEYKDSGRCYFVTARDIDLDIRRFAGIISGAVNHTLHPALTKKELELLLSYT